MVVTVVAVVGLVVLRSALSTDIEVKPEDVDYLAKVEQAQAAGMRPVYPPSLPVGWQATGAEVTPGQRPGFGLTMLTAEQRFVGIRQRSDSADDLLEEYVADDTDEGAPYQAAGSVAPTWETYSDSGGDLAYVAEVGGQTVLVYGSAGRSEIEQLVGSLTTRPLRGDAPSP
jgi:hypothetical protein